MTVEVRPSGSYRVRYRLASGERKAMTFAEPGPAQRFDDLVTKVGGEAAFQMEMAKIAADDAPLPPTVGECCRQHLTELTRPSAGTRRKYQRIINRDIVGHEIGDLPVTLLNRSAIAAWVRYLADDRDLSYKSMKNVTALLFSSMDTAVLNGHIGANPCVGIKLPRKRITVAKTYVPPDEFMLVLSYLDPYWHPLAVLLYTTGLRWSEATALPARDVFLTGTPPTLRVTQAWIEADDKPVELGPPKSDAALRTIPLTDTLVQMLRPLVAGKGRSETDFVFLNRGGRYVQDSAFYEGRGNWSQAQERLEAATGKHVRVHDFRGSFATNQLAANVPPHEVQYLMGHEDIQTTINTYASVGPDAVWRARDAAALSLVNAYPELVSG